MKHIESESQYKEIMARIEELLPLKSKFQNKNYMFSVWKILKNKTFQNLQKYPLQYFEEKILYFNFVEI